MAKKFLFNDFGVYANHDHTQTAAPWLIGQQNQPSLDSDSTASSPSCCATDTPVGLEIPEQPADRPM